jgi:hypothetical protein
MLSSHLRLGLPSGLLPLGLPTNIFEMQMEGFLKCSNIDGGWIYYIQIPKHVEPVPGRFAGLKVKHVISAWQSRN